MTPGPFRVDIERKEHFRFQISFDDDRWMPVIADEPEPLGSGAGPNAARLLAGAVGNCLAASLLLCLEKARVPVRDVQARVEGTMERNEKGRFRIPRLEVTLLPSVEGEGDHPRLGRCLEIFEEFCIVTQSVRDGIDVDVRVEPTMVEPVEADGAEPGGSDVGLVGAAG